MNTYRVLKTSPGRFFITVVGSNIWAEYSKDDVLLQKRPNDSIQITKKGEMDGLYGDQLFDPNIIAVGQIQDAGNANTPMADADAFDAWWEGVSDDDAVVEIEEDNVVVELVGDNIVRLNSDGVARGSVDYLIDGDYITIINISNRKARTKKTLYGLFVDDLNAPLFASVAAFEVWFSEHFFFNVVVPVIDPEIMEFKDSWNAATNTPTLADGDPISSTGNVYLVSVAGTHNFGSGAIDFQENDTVIYNGTIWKKGGNIGATPNLNTVMTAGNTTTKQLSISAAAATFAADFQGSNVNFRLAILTSASGSGIQSYNNAMNAVRYFYMQASGGSVGIGTTTEDLTAIMNMVSTTKGLLIPRMTTAQKIAIGSPGTATIGLMVVDTDLARLCIFTALGWLTILTSADIPTLPSFISGTAATNGNSATAWSITPGNTKSFTCEVNYQGKSAAGMAYSGKIFCSGRTTGVGTILLTGQSVIVAPISSFSGVTSVLFTQAGTSLRVTVTSDLPDGAVTWQVTGDYMVN